MKDFSSLSPDYIQDFEAREQLDYYNIEWTGIEERFDQHWTYDRIMHIQSMYKSKSRITKKVLENYEHIGSKQIEISFDLMMQGYVSGIFSSLDDVYSTWNEYWGFISHIMSNTSKPVLQIVLEQSIEDGMKYTVDINEKFRLCGREDLIQPPSIEPVYIKAAITEAQSKGILGSVRNPEIVSQMNALGWFLEKRGKSLTWIKH